MAPIALLSRLSVVVAMSVRVAAIAMAVIAIGGHKANRLTATR